MSIDQTSDVPQSAKRAAAHLVDEAILGDHWGTTEQILDALKDVVDPELGVNIVDLGLVYGVDIDAAGVATIDLTLTSPACPLTDQLETDVRYLVASLAKDVVINWVWLPPWSLDMITDDGREQLRAIGFSL
ncbi:MAG: metal-sulfur cluster assembly factor [Propionibacteriaceae bacterium]|jgi:metal-sulfur cluster biosynthetic enzyme|nr:metal-sulfur cluster assembly factor [Propionibacteriaceae bacterium]